ncbi:MAG TPA: hypothetical protein VJX74_10965 [Blastocatellia bacterium]|nr:hypothetical protein [Blastocatellia bacterium]
MRHSLFALICLVAILSTTFAVTPQQTQDAWLRVQTASGKTQFQIGEIIPLKLSFTSSAAKKYQISMATYDRSGRMNYEKFLVEPEAGWSDPLRSYFVSGGSSIGGLAGIQLLSQEPAIIQLDLNEWVRFDLPGKYSLRIVSHRVAEREGNKSLTESDSNFISNELQLTIVPASKSWQDETLKKAVATIDRIKSSSSKTAPAVNQATADQAALKVLRYLGTEKAVQELARHLRGEDSHTDFECMFGLFGSPYRDVAINEMNRLLVAPDHPVSSTFSYALCVLMRSQNKSPEEMGEEERKNQEIIRSQLLDAVSRKRGKALAVTLNTILETSGYKEGKPEPVSDQIASQLAAVFDQLPIEKQKEILDSKWDLIKGSAFLPILRKYAQQYKEFAVPNEMNAYDSLHLSGAALRRWYELEPDQARAVVIQEITRPKPRYTAAVLGILPDRTLPEVEQVLADNFVKQQGSDGVENLASLLQRYATDAVLPQVLPVVDKHVGKWACAIQAPALAYLLRVNPEVAKPRIEAAMSARGHGYSACNHSLLTGMGALQQDPVLEEIAVSGLDDIDPEVASNAASFLSSYGSPDIEEKLWDRLIRWNEKWRGKEDQFPFVSGGNNPNLWQGYLGLNLAQALSHARSWLADESRLRRLRQLALGASMQDQVDSLIITWEQKPWAISYYRLGDQQFFQLLQYRANSLKSFEEKLKQFAKGSSFIWTSSSEDHKKVFKELSEFLTSQGMKLSNQ